MKIYGLADQQNHLSYIGETDIKYIPVDKEVELNLGAARLVKIEPKLMGFRTTNYMYDSDGNINGFDEIRKWEIGITNTRQLPIEVEITRGFKTAYWTLHMKAKDVDYEKHDAVHARFKLKLPPQSKQSLEYTVTTFHGNREENLTKYF